jgi:uncharacterized protein (TIGR02246 family)
LGVLAVLAAVIPSSGYAQTRGHELAGEAEIRSVIVDMTEAFNRHDARAATEMYAANGDFVSVRGETAHGAGEAESKLAAIFTTRAREATLRTIDVRVRFIRPEVALAHVTNELSGLTAPDGQKLPAHQELSLRVFVKTDGKWQVSAFHNTLVRPFAAETSKSTPGTSP